MTKDKPACKTAMLIQKLRDKNGLLQTATRDANRLAVSLEDQLEVLRAVKDKDLAQIIIKKGRVKAGKKPHTAVALASDWHSCQLVSAAVTGGRNEHNTEIGSERAAIYFRDLAKLVKREQAFYQIDNLVLWLGGDFLVNDGMHGLDSARNVDETPLEEARHVRSLLTSGIDYLLKNLDCNIQIPCSIGNHGRTTLKRPTRRAHGYSHEQDVYLSLAQNYSKEKRVSFDVSEASVKVIDIAGWKMGLNHGDSGLKNGSGIGGLAGPLKTLVQNKWAPTYGVQFGCTGHYHTLGFYPYGVTNGCLVGWDEFAVSLGIPYDRPSQAFFLVDHERQTVGKCMPIWVD